MHPQLRALAPEYVLQVRRNSVRRARLQPLRYAFRNPQFAFSTTTKRAHGCFVKDKDGRPYEGTWWKCQGSLIDFTNPDAKAWRQGQVGPAGKAGANGVKDDDAEGTSGPMRIFADGTEPFSPRPSYPSKQCFRCSRHNEEPSPPLLATSPPSWTGCLSWLI
jgi:hypothetical protein